MLPHGRSGAREYIVCASVVLGPNSDPTGAIPAIIAGDRPDRHRPTLGDKNMRPATACAMAGRLVRFGGVK
jgi:hypothetical protein